MGKAGRPRKEIKKIEFEKLCVLQCTQQEICDFFQVDHKTLTSWCKREYGEEYSQVYRQKRAGGKISLRRAQFKLAEKSAAMAIFLGKNMLGQSDHPEREAGADDCVSNGQISQRDARRILDSMTDEQLASYEQLCNVFKDGTGGDSK